MITVTVGYNKNYPIVINQGYRILTIAEARQLSIDLIKAINEVESNIDLSQPERVNQ